jgi:hypothetical protein
LQHGLITAAHTNFTQTLLRNVVVVVVVVVVIIITGAGGAADDFIVTVHCYHMQ